jgi:hypothetical protein
LEGKELDSKAYNGGLKVRKSNKVYENSIKKIQIAYLLLDKNTILLSM